MEYNLGDDPLSVKSKKSAQKFFFTKTKFTKKFIHEIHRKCFCEHGFIVFCQDSSNN